MSSSREIRQRFIDHFARGHDHTFVPSASVVPHDDPTLLFTNAGMNQFKDVFLATGTRPYHRAVNSQKCVRAGGKHNDLEDVGRDSYHHTFFEMLGNWSFGDYFKREAIGWAWSLLTETFALPRERLHVTVFGGDKADGVEPDQEAETLWREVTDIDPSHLSRWGRKDNFWEMGESGPCGPCSEIHIDLTPDASGADRVNADDPEVIELWNLVFVQFNRDASGNLTELPARHIDTGLGLERLTRVLQGVDSNYDTDLFRPIFDVVADIAGGAAYGGALEAPRDIAFRVIADHIRALSFCIADGADPGNEGRGYVLRRILRRAVRHGWQTLEIKEPFLHRLVPTVVDLMEPAFPELVDAAEGVIDRIRDEEIAFARTLSRGIALFEEAAAGGADLSGDSAFRLHDTYGFPLDLTQVMAAERGLSVDTEGFHARMEAARQRARAATADRPSDQVLLDLVQQEAIPETQFTGYEATRFEGNTAWRLFCVEGTGYRSPARAEVGESVILVAETTPFYAESGGQMGDRGVIRAGEASLHVETVVRFGGVVMHLGTVGVGPLEISDADGSMLCMEVDSVSRQKVMANHTCTHLLNQALRKHVDAEIDQKGSSVTDERLRFDLGYDAAVTEAEMMEVETEVNAWIGRDIGVYTGYAGLEAGQRIEGLRAVFGEKYPPRVRIVAIGAPVEQLLADPGNATWRDHSIEFCGGTHLARTGLAEVFVVVQEEAVSRGVRRVTALTGAAAQEVRSLGDALEGRLDAAEAVGPDALGDVLPPLIHAMGEAVVPWLQRASWRPRLAALQKQLKDLQKSAARSASDDVVAVAREVAGRAESSLIVAEIPAANASTLRTAMDVIRKMSPEAALLLGARDGGKVAFVAAVPEPRIAQGLRAGDWVKVAATVAGGGGGGRPDMAQAGGKQPEKLGDALATAEQYAREILA